MYVMSARNSPVKAFVSSTEVFCRLLPLGHVKSATANGGLALSALARTWRATAGVPLVSRCGVTIVSGCIDCAESPGATRRRAPATQAALAETNESIRGSGVQDVGVAALARCAEGANAES